jgi:hypothetical protein
MNNQHFIVGKSLLLAREYYNKINRKVFAEHAEDPHSNSREISSSKNSPMLYAKKKTTGAQARQLPPVAVFHFLP